MIGDGADGGEAAAGPGQRECGLAGAVPAGLSDQAAADGGRCWGSASLRVSPLPSTAFCCFRYSAPRPLSSSSGGSSRPRRLANGRFGSQEAAGAALRPGRRPPRYCGPGPGPAERCPCPAVLEITPSNLGVRVFLIKVVNLIEPAPVACLVLLGYFFCRQIL